MENKIKVSIIIPVYNTEQYLRQCLDSVINQTFQDIEIIVVNDGSTDNSINIIKEYQQKDSRIVFVDFPNHKGVSDARNEGIKLARAEYITFVDSDDWVKKDYVKTLYDNITKYNCDIVVTNFYFHDKDKTKKLIEVMDKRLDGLDVIIPENLIVDSQKSDNQNEVNNESTKNEVEQSNTVDSDETENTSKGTITDKVTNKIDKVKNSLKK